MSVHCDAVCCQENCNSRFNLMWQYFWWSLDSTRASLVKGVTSLLKYSPKYQTRGAAAGLPSWIWMARFSRKARSCHCYSAFGCAHLAFPYYSNQKSFTWSVSVLSANKYRRFAIVLLESTTRCDVAPLEAEGRARASSPPPEAGFPLARACRSSPLLPRAPAMSCCTTQGMKRYNFVLISASLGLEDGFYQIKILALVVLDHMWKTEPDVLCRVI